MKFDNETVRELVRKRREEAGEVIQPTRRVRRRLHRGPVPAAEGSGATSVPAEGRTVKAAEPSHVATKIVGARGQAVEAGEVIEAAEMTERAVGAAETVEAAEVPEWAVGAAEIYEAREQAIETTEVAVAAEVPVEPPSEEAPASEPAIGEAPIETASVEGAGEVVVIVSDPPTPSGLGVEEASERAERAEEEVRKSAAERLVVAAQVWDAEARLEEAESRAWRGEAEAKSAAERAQKVVSDHVASPAVQREIAEAAADAYLQGFGDCKTKMATAYGLDDTEAIRPGDPDVPETPVVGADMEEAADDEEEEAGEAPQRQQ